MRKIKISSISLLMVITFFQVNISKAQMVGPDAYIKATSLEIGLDGQGGFEGCSTTTSPPLPGMHFRSGNPLFGFVANPQVNLWTTYDGDFFTPGTPENGWGIEIGTTGGVSASNNATSVWGIPGAITDWSHTFDCYSADWEGDLTSGTDLHFKINYFLQETDLFYTTTVAITNNTAATIPELYYYRNLDPDNNVSISSDYTTQNTIVSQPGTGCDLAHVSATSLVPASQPQSYLGLAAIGANWRAMYGGFLNRDGSDIWNGSTAGFVQTVGSTNFADEAIALAYKIQNLAPGATEVIKFVVILDDASAAQAINNLLYLSYPGSVIGTPQVCTPYIDTIPTCGGPIPISVTGTALSDYNWTWSPTTGLSPSTGPSVIANPGVTTTYTVSGAPISACVGPISFTFVVEVTPGAGNNPYITPVPPICVSNAPFALTVDSLGGVWSGTGITNTSTGIFDPSVAGIGTYMISYVTPGSCNATDTVMITVNSGPDATINPAASVCVGATPFNLSAVTAGGVWSGTGITSAASGTFNPATAGVGPHIITYTISGVCSAIDTVVVNVVAAFSSTITPHASVCQGSPSFNFSAASPGGTWTGTGITSASAGTFNPTTAGTFVITYSIPGSCGSTDTENITVIPQADATITAASPICSNGTPFNMAAVSSGGTWTGIGITSGSAGTFDPSVSGSGTFTITYSISGACGDTATQLVTVNPAPTPTFSSNINSGCPNTCIDFSESVSTICANVVYVFGDGDSSFVTSPIHCYTTPGTYSVSLQCIDANGCIGSINNASMITIYPIPVANFTMSPTSPVPPNTTIGFNDISSGGTTSFWEFDDIASGAANTSTLSSPSHTYDNQGDYCVTLVSSNAGGCLDTVKYCIVVIGEGTIFIPNIFTPNADGTNDQFIVSSTNMKEISYVIYDRWGLKIAEYNGLTGGWDGHTKNGRMAPDGTYYYILNATARNNKTFNQSGFLELLSK
ncbi:MAG: gliding motility-associated C-terminal domain-containing protein [Bacteroidetes bacterium]|nr:gliding motility-associated C-terminal domain-containing protein [Bacteroidota bacterium]